MTGLWYVRCEVEQGATATGGRFFFTKNSPSGAITSEDSLDFEDKRGGTPRFSPHEFVEEVWGRNSQELMGTHKPMNVCVLKMTFIGGAGRRGGGREV